MPGFPILLLTQVIKNLPEIQETWVHSLSWEDPLEKEVETHPSILARRILWTQSLGGYSPWGLKDSDTTSTFTFSKSEFARLNDKFQFIFFLYHLNKGVNSVKY